MTILEEKERDLEALAFTLPALKWAFKYYLKLRKEGDDVSELDEELKAILDEVLIIKLKQD